MRWYVLRVLLWKEALRHWANRGGLVLLLLLVVVTMLLSLFDRGGAEAAAGLVSPVEKVVIDSEDADWSDFLEAHAAPELKRRLRYRDLADAATGPDGRITYDTGTAAIQIRRPSTEGGPWKVWVWYPPGGKDAVAPFEEWFFATSRRYFRREAGLPDERSAAGDANPRLEAYRFFRQGLIAAAGTDGPTADRIRRSVPELTVEHSILDLGGVDLRATVAGSLVLFALLIPSVYLLPSLTCEERERGVLLAQALSPASPAEIIAAKFLFYPPLGVALAALLGGIYNPAALGRWYFWASILALSLGAVGIGMTVATIARTQRAASTGAMCYMLAVTVLIVVCQEVKFTPPAMVTLEFHGPRMMQAVLNRATTTYRVDGASASHLIAAWALAAAWCGVAVWQFRRRGWQ